MEALVSTFSLGRLADLLARAVGWSPVGHRLELAAADDVGDVGDATTATLAVQVVAAEGDDLVVEPEAPGRERGRWRLSARHRGWTARSLMLVAVAMNVKADGRGGAAPPFALAMARRRA